MLTYAWKHKSNHTHTYIDNRQTHRALGHRACRLAAIRCLRHCDLLVCRRLGQGNRYTRNPCIVSSLANLAGCARTMAVSSSLTSALSDVVDLLSAARTVLLRFPLEVPPSARSSNIFFVLQAAFRTYLQNVISQKLNLRSARYRKHHFWSSSLFWYEFCSSQKLNLRSAWSYSDHKNWIWGPLGSIVIMFDPLYIS